MPYFESGRIAKDPGNVRLVTEPGNCSEQTGLPSQCALDEIVILGLILIASGFEKPRLQLLARAPRP